MKLSSFNNTIAVDLGTDYTRIYYKGNIINEPSVVAYDAIDGRVIALGRNAADMIGKNPETILVEKPLKGGVISNFELACQMIQGFLSEIMGGVIKPRVIIAVPYGVTDVERRAICDVIRESDIREVYVVLSPVAGAIGANCDVSLARGMMLVDVGGGKCDIAAISLGQIVGGRSLRFGGDAFTSALSEFVLERHSLSIGEQSAEKLKKSVACVFNRARNSIEEVAGYNVKLKKPEKAVIRSEETKDAFAPVMSDIVTEIKSTLDELPTELLSDIMEDGILLIGGGSQLYGFAKYLRLALSMKVFLAEDADMCVIRGAGYVADNMDKLSDNTYIFTKG